MLEVVGAVVCACFAVCWAALILANVIQIRHRRTKNRQILNHYITRVNVLLCIIAFIANICVFSTYFLVGAAYEAVIGIGTISLILVTQIIIGICSFINYQALLAAYTLDEVVANKNTALSLRRGFIAINVGSTVSSLVVAAVMLVLNRMWLLGLLKLMWAVVVVLLLLAFWSHFTVLVRAARTLAEAVGVKRVHNSFLKPVLATAFASVILLGLIGTGILELLDTQQVHHLEHRVSYFPLNELMLLLTSSNSTFFAWLPLGKTQSSNKKTGVDTRYVFDIYSFLPLPPPPPSKSRLH
jgi:hypothetical protein